jgi:hypothetical protein
MDSAIRLREAFRELKISSCSGIETFREVLELQTVLDNFIRANGAVKNDAYNQLRYVLTKHDKHKEFKLVIYELDLVVDLPCLN